MLAHPPSPTLFPYTTLFRSDHAVTGPFQRPRVEALAKRPFVGSGNDEYKVEDRKSTRLNSSHQITSYAVFCLKKNQTRLTHQLNRCPFPQTRQSSQSVHLLC